MNVIIKLPVCKRLKLLFFYECILFFHLETSNMNSIIYQKHNLTSFVLFLEHSIYKLAVNEV